MGAFGIFIAVTTLVYVIYYVVTISLDLSKLNKKNTDSKEVIKAGGGSVAGSDVEESPTEDEPVKVEEFDDGGYGIKEPGKEEEVVTGEQTQKSVPGDGQSARIAAAKSAEEKADTISPEYEGQSKSEDYDDDLRQLEAAEQTFDMGFDDEDEH